MPRVDEMEQQVHWTMMAAFVLESLGLLDDTKLQKLSELSSEHSGANWYDLIAEDQFIHAN